MSNSKWDSYSVSVLYGTVLCCRGRGIWLLTHKAFMNTRKRTSWRAGGSVRDTRGGSESGVCVSGRPRPPLPYSHTCFHPHASNPDYHGPAQPQPFPSMTVYLLCQEELRYASPVSFDPPDLPSIPVIMMCASLARPRTCPNRPLRTWACRPTGTPCARVHGCAQECGRGHVGEEPPWLRGRHGDTSHRLTVWRRAYA